MARKTSSKYQEYQSLKLIKKSKLDRCWGYRGVRGYGINYGKCHIV